MRRSLTTVPFALAMLHAATAQANIAAVERKPARVVGPWTARETALVVEHEKLELRCEERSGRPLCTFEARYAIANPTAARVEAAAAFYGVATRGVEVRIDGAPAPTDLSAEERAALSAAASAAREAVGRKSPEELERPPAALATVAFAVAAESGSRHEIVVTGQMVPGLRFTPAGYGQSAVQARHMVYSEPDAIRIYDAEYLLWPLRTWQGEPQIDVRIAYPASWRVALGGDEGRWAESEEGDAVVRSATLSASDDAVIALEMEPAESPLRAGGILVAAGGTIGEYSGPRGRIGYEFAAPSFLLHSVTADTDFRKRFIVTPLVEAASPAVLILPSFGIGVGMPVQIAPDPRVGVRLQGDIHLYSVGFVGSVDFYPKFGEELPGFVEASFLGQIGL